jgi:hypothetical protein
MPPLPAATFEYCRNDVAFDGALIDVLVPGVDTRQCELFWTSLLSLHGAITVTRDGESVAVPKTWLEGSAEAQDAAVTASIKMGALTVNCHFFDGELELDVDPREVNSEQAFEDLIGLMRLASSSTGLKALATPEGGRSEHAFICVLPDGSAMYIPSRAVPPNKSLERTRER